MNATKIKTRTGARQMTYGDSIAIKILVAERMGMGPALVEQAGKQLRGEAVHPIMGAAMDKEAARIHNEMRMCVEMVELANEHGAAILAEHGFAVRVPQTA